MYPIPLHHTDNITPPILAFHHEQRYSLVLSECSSYSPFQNSFGYTIAPPPNWSLYGSGDRFLEHTQLRFISPLFIIMGSSYSLIEDKKSFSIVMPGTEDLKTGSVAEMKASDR